MLCLEDNSLKEIPRYRCGLLVLPSPASIPEGSITNPCLYPNIDAQTSWDSSQAEKNIQTFISGGIDTVGVYWPGQKSGETFAQALGSSLTGISAVQCSFEQRCHYQLSCDEIGSHSAAMLGKEVLPLEWGLPALNSLQNINQQLSNQYVAIKGAGVILALDTFSIGDFFPSPDGRLNMVKALTGLGTILSVVSGFVPGIGPDLAATGAILPAVGTFLGNTAASKSDPPVGQKEFAPRVRELYTTYVNFLDKAGEILFKGDTIDTTIGAFNITDMMAHGAWANSSALTRLTDLETI